MSIGFSAHSITLHTAPCGDGAWDDWVCSRTDGHTLQLAGWAQLKQRFGWQMQRVALADAGGQLRAGAQLLFRSTAGLKMAYVPRGPLTDWSDQPMTAAIVRALTEAARQAGAAVLKIEPGLPDTPHNRAMLQDFGFVASRQTVQPPSTIVVDLEEDDDAILQHMKSKWRYNIRLSDRKEVTVRYMERADLPVFDQLMAATGRRDGFAVHSPEYFTTAFDMLCPRRATFLLAEYAGVPLGAIVVSLAGTSACYLWGASSDRERSRMPNHALQWAGMQWARRQGATHYDLWGIPDAIGLAAAALRGGDGTSIPVDELAVNLEALPEGDLWGVYRFKQGFGGKIVRAVGAWDLAINPIGYRVYQIGLSARAQISSLRAANHSRNGGASEPDPTALNAHGVVRAGVRLIENAIDWRAALADLPDPHVLQSWEWGEIKRQTGWRAEHVVLSTSIGSAAFQFLWRQPVDGAPLRVAYVPKGPLLDWTNLELVDITLDAVEAYARDKGCIFVKVDPDVRSDDGAGHLVLHALQRRGWRFSPDQVQFKNTAYSDLAQGEEALLAGMKSKWRYNVRLAEKRGITVRTGTVNDLNAFYQLYAETGLRDGFLIRPSEYYRVTWETMLAAQADPTNPAGGVLLLADHPDDSAPLAGLFLMRYGRRAWYFYGASAERHRRDMPNYLLQWEALRWSCAQGCAVYDWWGAPTAIDDEQDAMQGVWQFKQGFGAVFQPHIGAWDFAVQPMQYRLYTEAMPAVLGAMRRMRSGPEAESGTSASNN